MSDQEEIAKAFAYLNLELIKEIQVVSIIKEFPADTEILREGQYIKVIPIVLRGLIKVFTRYEEKELLLYYIKAHESCIMSFSASLKNLPSKIFAITEEDTRALLIPANKIPEWINQFPDINTLFYQQYNIRYSDLLDTIHHLLYDKMDKRLLDYLNEKVQLTNKNPLKISHRQIAGELGTAREVVSRLMKKLEAEGLVKQQANAIEIL